MASIRPYRTAKGDRRYEVRYRSSDGGQRSRAFSARKDAQAFKLDMERRRQAGELFQAQPRTVLPPARAILARAVRGRRCEPSAGRGPRSVALAHEKPRSAWRRSSELSVERLRRPLAEDLIASISERAPRRAEMGAGVAETHPARGRGARAALSIHTIYRIRIARTPRNANLGLSRLGRGRRASSLGCPNPSGGLRPLRS